MTPNHHIHHVAEITITYSHKVKPSLLPKVNASESAYELLLESWDNNTIEMVETFKCMYLNRNNRVLGIMTISTGGMHSAIADPSRVFAGAIKANAHGIILAHNHPSGNLSASSPDIDLTQKLKKAGEILGIPVLDHIIVTTEGYYSMADNMDV